MEMSADTEARSATLSWIIKVAVSATVLGATLWFLPTDEVWRAIKKIAPGLWVSVLAVFLAGHAVSATKWWLLVSRKGELRLRDAVRAHFAGLVANLCLPGIAGGDVVRAGMVIRGSQNKTHIAVGSIADRLLDSFGLILLACGGALFSLEIGAGSTDALVKAGLLFLLALGGIAGLMIILPRLPQKGIVEKVSTAVLEFRRQPGKLVLCLAMSMAVQAVFILSTIALATGGVEVPVASWFLAWPLAKLLAILPVSIAGLGVREASLAALLLPFGAAPAKVVAASLLWQSILFAGGLIGGLALLMTGRKNKHTDTQMTSETHD